jgi:hypothetical protein
MALKQAAKDVFGMEGLVYTPYDRRPPRAGQLALARRAAQLTYRETQAALAERGITEVTLYRGLRRQYSQPGALEAWTSAPGIAEEFAGSEGLVLRETVTARRIFAWYDRPGWVEGPKGQQFEWIVLAEEPR